MMDAHRCSIEEEDLDSLRQLLGVEVSFVIGAQFSVRQTRIAAPHFSISIAESKWVNFSCEWHETEIHRLDYWHMRIGETPSPMGVQRDKFNSMIGLCDVFVGTAAPVARISVLESSARREHPDEQVVFDYGIKIARADGVEFLIAIEPTIANRVQFLMDAASIKAATIGCRERIQLGI